MVSSIKRSASRLMGLDQQHPRHRQDGLRPHERLSLKTISLAGIAGRAFGILESLAAQKEIKMVLAASEEFSVEADPDLMERVFTNLVGNAIKFTPLKGTITVAIDDLGPALRVCIEDTGEGIPENYRDRIFQKFEQVTGQRHGGTGLGLTITKFFIEAHLGRIWVESEMEKGSRFYFTVPKHLVLDAEGASWPGRVAEGGPRAAAVAGPRARARRDGDGVSERGRAARRYAVDHLEPLPEGPRQMGRDPQVQPPASSDPTLALPGMNLRVPITLIKGGAARRPPHLQGQPRRLPAQRRPPTGRTPRRRWSSFGGLHPHHGGLQG